MPEEMMCRECGRMFFDEWSLAARGRHGPQGESVPGRPGWTKCYGSRGWNKSRAAPRRGPLEAVHKITQTGACRGPQARYIQESFRDSWDDRLNFPWCVGDGGAWTDFTSDSDPEISESDLPSESSRECPCRGSSRFVDSDCYDFQHHDLNGEGSDCYGTDP